jgi:hypothetical protein
MFTFIAKLLLKSLINTNKISHSQRFLSWEKIDRIAIIISNKETLNKNELDKFIEKTQKYVEVYYVELNSKLPTYSDLQCFTKKDKTFLKLPKQIIKEKLQTKKIQVVINTSDSSDLFSIALSNSFLANTEIANFDIYKNVNLIIKRNENQLLTNYLDVVISYLKMIKEK